MSVRYGRLREIVIGGLLGQLASWIFMLAPLCFYVFGFPFSKRQFLGVLFFCSIFSLYRFFVFLKILFRFVVEEYEKKRLIRQLDEEFGKRKNREKGTDLFSGKPLDSRK